MYSHMLMLASSAGSSQLLSKVVRDGSSKSAHDARVKSLLDSATGLLDLGLVLVDCRLRSAVFEDAVNTQINQGSRTPVSVRWSNSK